LITKEQEFLFLLVLNTVPRAWAFFPNSSAIVQMRTIALSKITYRLT